MATHTTHYNLIKPALNDKVKINDFNDNADKIDTALYGKVNTSDTENIITSANNCIMSDGVTSVEDAVNEKGVVFYTSEYNVTVIAQQHGSDVQIHFTATGIDYHLNGQKIWTISKNS